MTARRIHPVILCGGAGTRLWPMSRELYPKQLLPMASLPSGAGRGRKPRTGGHSLLQDTVRRVEDARRFAPPLLVCNEEHRFIVAEQMRELGVTPRAILLEPAGRNTAPAIAVAALAIAAEDPEAVLLVLPSDHVITEPGRFRRAVATAARAARAGAFVTLGLAPAGPEPGYGYIRRGPAWPGIAGCFRVRRFVEKPSVRRARAFLAGDDWHWNSGIFVMGARRCLDELERRHPAIVRACRRAVERGGPDLDFFRLDAGAFRRAPKISIDHAILEHSREVAVVPVRMGWDDVGSWPALWRMAPKDRAGNVLVGDVIARGVRNSYLRSEHGLVAAIGVDDLLVVATDDAVAVAPREESRAVQELVDELRARKRAEHVVHSHVYRPWGHYRNIDRGERFQVKQIAVKPGAKLSLQKHRHRAEHWVVVNGTARITRGEDSFLLEENESTFIPVGVAHRIENAGRDWLRLIEVQSGRHLSEGDIVRLEDSYGRGEAAAERRAAKAATRGKPKARPVAARKSRGRTKGGAGVSRSRRASPRRG